MKTYYKMRNGGYVSEYTLLRAFYVTHGYTRSIHDKQFKEWYKILTGNSISYAIPASKMSVQMLKNVTSTIFINKRQRVFQGK